MRRFRPRILFIDAYDSFSNNIISLLETTLEATVLTVKIDNPLLLRSEDDLLVELRQYDAVVCGPGPGNPRNAQDVGLIGKIWQLGDDALLPVLGICLGFQSLCLHFGGRIKRLQGPQHGIVRRVNHIGEDAGPDTIFRGVGVVHATLYQSLCADIGHDKLPNESYKRSKWTNTKIAPDLKPLAWVEYDGPQENNKGIQDARVLVAVQHKTKPFWGLQYHPESICTNDESRRLIWNWFQDAQAWNQSHGRTPHRNGSVRGEALVKESLFQQVIKPFDSNVTNQKCHYRKLRFNHDISIPTVVEALRSTDQEHIILESSNASVKTSGSVNVKGRYSIVGLDVDDSYRIEYKAGESYHTVRRNCHDYPDVVEHAHGIYRHGIQTRGIWPHIAKYLNSISVADGPKDSPFWGGFMGYTTYELGLEGIAVEGTRSRQHPRPDLCFAWIEKSLIIDHSDNSILVQVLAPQEANVDHWPIFTELINKVRLADVPAVPSQPEAFGPAVTSLITPLDDHYEQNVSTCQSHIRAGSSYELCLTAQTTATLSPAPSPWSLYKSLRQRQPAPFAAYIRLGSATFISASPERFISFSPSGECELRPMKGTVRKSPDVQTLEQAEKLLSVPKERAENLMIVDLVRHDLHGICGSGNVSVPKLMVVEEYESVFQMISVVKGQIPQPSEEEWYQDLSEAEKERTWRERYTGLDVLAASLPPGSMTGAPKKRSCELLSDIEGRERSLYSGVVGYIDVRGKGDWSVNIRCMYKWDDEDIDISPDGYTFKSGFFTEEIRTSASSPENADSPISSEGIDTPDYDSDVDAGMQMGSLGNDSRNHLKHGEQGKVAQHTYHIGAGGAVTALSTPVGEREEMLTKLRGTLAMFRE